MESRPRGQRGHRRFSVRFRHVERGRKWGIRVPKTALEEGLSKWRLGDNEHNNGRQKQKEETGRLPLVSVSGNTFLDPFQTYPSSVAAATAGQIVRHAVEIYWPNFFPGSSLMLDPSTGSTIANVWFDSAMRDPTTLHGMLYGAASHMRICEQAASLEMAVTIRPDRERDRSILDIVSLTIRNIQDVINSRPLVITDGVIMAAFCLASHPAQRRYERLEWQTKPPLWNMQWLGFYNDVTISPGHLQGLGLLIHARGGLEAIELPGLAETLSVSGLILATKLLLKPSWPVQLLDRNTAPTLERRMECLPWTLDRARVAPFQTALTPTAMSILHRLFRYTAFLDIWTKGNDVLNLKDACNERLLVHHGLMSLPDADTLRASGSAVAPGYEATRLAPIVYSLTVVFPVPLSSTPYPLLASRIRSALIDESEALGSSSSLLLWIVVMGGIAAVKTQERSWYVDMLGKVLVDARWSSWEHIHAVLGKMLWLAGFHDVEGYKMWEEWCGADRLLAEGTEARAL